MPRRKPIHCRPRAFEWFAAHVPTLATTDSLQQVAVAIAMHEMADIDPAEVSRRLQALADRARQRVRAPSTQALLAHLHDVLFEEEGLIGNTDDYDDPRNSYLPAVIDRRVGLPITLALVYKLVGERAGLTIHGINSPGHFLAAVQEEPDLGHAGWMLVDPFFGGRVLSRPEARQIIARVIGAASAEEVDQDPSGQGLFAPATHPQWIARILQNLINSLERAGRVDDLAAMLELRALLPRET